MNPASTRSTWSRLFGRPVPPPSVWVTATTPSTPAGAPAAVRSATRRTKPLVREVVASTTTKLRVPTPRPPGRRKPSKVAPESAGSTCRPGVNDASSSSQVSMVSVKLAAAGSSKSMSRSASAVRIFSLQTYSPGRRARAAMPNGSPHEVRRPPRGIGARTNRCPSRTVWGRRKSCAPSATAVPASRRRVAIATLSSGAGMRATSVNSKRSDIACSPARFGACGMATVVVGAMPGSESLRNRYPERVNFWKHCAVNGARRAAAPDATVTSPT